jgi:23S rRNA pseudouridine2605 synthase
MFNQNEGIRLQKILAQAGVGSRRKCEELIASGRVSVNGKIVDELGARAFFHDIIEVDGVPVLAEDKVVYAFNKPLGVVSAMFDSKQPNLGDYFNLVAQRVFHVGRLDVDSEGLLLLTNDGDLADKISHPRYEISKTYQLEIVGYLSESERKRLLLGIELSDGVTKLDSVKTKAKNPNTSLIEVRIHSGKNRILRRIFDEINHPVKRLIRTHIGHLGLDQLKPGEMKVLSFQEIERIFS